MGGVHVGRFCTLDVFPSESIWCSSSVCGLSSVYGGIKEDDKEIEEPINSPLMGGSGGGRGMESVCFGR